jgi:hypothetical protein
MFDFWSSTSASHPHALVVVVDRHRERALGFLLRDDVVVQDGVDVERLREVVEVELRRSGELLVDDLVAEIDALVADVDTRTSDQLLDLSLTFSAEATKQLLVALARPSHPVSPFTPISPSMEGARQDRCSITRSMIP